jgi:tripartite-type tricarboxylate transporter receptor subunit TctC
VIATKLAQKWGQAVIVENKPGAAGQVGADYVSRAKPDADRRRYAQIIRDRNISAD